MAFRLFIARGISEGQSFTSQQPVVVIGRESSCDLVLTDPGVSGRHLRLSERDGRFFVFDLQSANGTLVNGSRVAVETEITRGDSLGVGTAVVQLQAADAEPSNAKKRAAARHVEDDETTLPVGKPLPREGPVDRSRYEADTDKTTPIGSPIAVEPVQLPTRPDRPLLELPTQQAQAQFPEAPERERATAEAPSEHDTSDPHRHTKATEMVPPLPAAAEVLTRIDAPTVHEPLPPPVPDHQGPSVASVLVPASVVLKRKPDQAAIPTTVREATQLVAPQGLDDPTSPSGLARPELPAPSPAGRAGGSSEEERASDRARRKRQAFATLGGQLGWYWGELSLRARILIAGVAGLVLLGGVFALWRVFRSPPGVALPSEPSVLTVQLAPYSYGLGDGVDYEHVDFKELRFDVAAATAVAVVVHYRARAIGHEEVAVSVNGHDVGFVPADTGMPERELEALLSQFVLKRNETNTVLFDNVKNPPGKEPWRISHLWMELVPVPDFTPEQALAAAKDAYTRAELLEKQRAAGDDTLFRLWRTYRTGWIALLPLEENKRTWLFAELKHRADVTRGELDVQCGTIMLEAKKQMELKNPDAARDILEGVSRFFPTREHSCPAQAEDKLREYDL